MANYDGFVAGYYDEVIMAEVDRRRVNAFVFSDEKSYEDTYSLKMLPGETIEIWYGCDAGDVTISVYVWASEHATNCRMKVIDPDTQEVMGEDVNESTETWEQLSVTFTAEKKVYKVILGNYTAGSYVVGDKKPCYFDKLE